MRSINYFLYRTVTLAALFLFYAADIVARAGGGGGRSSSRGSSHSSGGGYHSSGGGYHSSGGGGVHYIGRGNDIDSGPWPLIIIFVIVVLVIVFKIKNWFINDKANYDLRFSAPSAYPEGLSRDKVQASFLSIQDAWQRKDLKNVRRWISDGVYQRYTAQFSMMNKLSQVNKLNNIIVNGMRVVKTHTDGRYHTADVAISFRMDDSFVSDKYPQFNESYQGDQATEVWTYIKRNDAEAGKNLYSTNNCPNCGAPFETQMGEISRCSGCGTLTNNASYDWVLSEITQEEDYSNGYLSTEERAELEQELKNDKFFAVQRMEDIASNVFMQVMEVLSGGKDKKLARFADKETTEKILELKKQGGNFIFDRLYLNDVSLMYHVLVDDRLELAFNLTATFQRLSATGSGLRQIDPEMAPHNFSISLSRNLNTLTATDKETVYSYECTSCGAPYDDTTNDSCTYCGETVVDLNKNWVMTEFKVV